MSSTGFTEHCASSKIIFHAGLMICEDHFKEGEFTYEGGEVGGDIELRKDSRNLEIRIAGILAFRGNEEGFYFFNAAAARETWSLEVFTAASEKAKVALAYQNN